jgi:hypothetical protein
MTGAGALATQQLGSDQAGTSRTDSTSTSKNPPPADSGGLMTGLGNIVGKFGGAAAGQAGNALGKNIGGFLGSLFEK